MLSNTEGCYAQVHAHHRGMVRVVERISGRCLGFRRSVREAQWLADSLNNERAKANAAGASA